MWAERSEPAEVQVKRAERLLSLAAQTPTNNIIPACFARFQETGVFKENAYEVENSRMSMCILYFCDIGDSIHRINVQPFLNQTHILIPQYTISCE